MKRTSHTRSFLLMIITVVSLYRFCDAMATQAPMNDVSVPKVESEVGERFILHMRQQLKEPFLELLASSEFTTKAVFKKRLEDATHVFDQFTKDTASELEHEPSPALPAPRALPAAASDAPVADHHPDPMTAPAPTKMNVAPMPPAPVPAKPVALPVEHEAPNPMESHDIEAHDMDAHDMGAHDDMESSDMGASDMESPDTGSSEMGAPMPSPMPAAQSSGMPAADMSAVMGTSMGGMPDAQPATGMPML